MESSDLEKIMKLPLFGELAGGAFTYISESDVLKLEEDEILFCEGDEADKFYIILEGRMRIFRTIKGDKLEINTYQKGDTAGEMPILTGSYHSTSAQAVEPSEVWVLKTESFWKMMADCPSIRIHILEKMSERLRELQLLTQQREKLISLGTLAAGLAHELNNPASAARRASQQLVKVVERLEKLSAGMWYHCHSDEEVSMMQQLEEHVLQSEGVTSDNDPLARSDKEDEMLTWLEEQGFPEAGTLASSLVETGISKEMLEPMVKKLSRNEMKELVGWTEANLSIKSLLKRLLESTIRISDLVQAVKEYSHSDMNERQEVDLHKGINNTLIILGHKIRRKKIKLVKTYDPEIEKVRANGSKLNQVWTNILDNSIEALQEGGVIRINTFRENYMVFIEISDNGPGIPEEIQPHVFEPFFTTKGVGEGSGLGLEIVHHIIVTQHKGSVKLISEPGETTFSVAIPDSDDEEEIG